MEETVFHRQLDILPPSRATKAITVIGTGGIGSITSLCLAKIGCSDLHLFDHDTVEMANVPSQFFHPAQAQAGLHKVAAIADTIYTFTGVDTSRYQEKWVNQITTPIVVSCVDSMATRKEIYDTLKTQYGVELYVEARMGAEKMRIYALRPSDPDHQKFYEANLYTDEEADVEVCTAKAIAYNTFVIGGIISSIVKKHLMDQLIPREIIFNLDNYTFLKGKDL